MSGKKNGHWISLTKSRKLDANMSNLDTSSKFEKNSCNKAETIFLIFEVNQKTRKIISCFKCLTQSNTNIFPDVSKMMTT